MIECHTPSSVEHACSARPWQVLDTFPQFLDNYIGRLIRMRWWVFYKLLHRPRTAAAPRWLPRVGLPRSLPDAEFTKLDVRQIHFVDAATGYKF